MFKKTGFPIIYNSLYLQSIRIHRSKSKLCILAYNRFLQKLSNYTDINAHLKQNSISNVALNIGRYISEKYYGAILKTDKNVENGYYLVKWTSDSYILQFYHKIERDIIKDGGFVCGVLYLNTFANFKQWYIYYGKKNEGK